MIGDGRKLAWHAPDLGNLGPCRRLRVSGSAAMSPPASVRSPNVQVEILPVRGQKVSAVVAGKIATMTRLLIRVVNGGTGSEQLDTGSRTRWRRCPRRRRGWGCCSDGGRRIRGDCFQLDELVASTGLSFAQRDKESVMGAATPGARSCFRSDRLDCSIRRRSGDHESDGRGLLPRKAPKRPLGSRARLITPQTPRRQ